MKKLYFLTLCFLLFFSVNAQIVNIPDPELKNALINATVANQIASTQTPVYNVFLDQWQVSNYNVIDTNGDGEIQLSEAQAVKFLVLEDLYNTDTIGLEAFTNLEYLDFSNNFYLENLDVTNLTNLKYIRCESNVELLTLNVSGLTNLLQLNCSSNELTSLNISSLTNLQKLYCANNNLTSLNASQNFNLEFLNCFDNQINNLNIIGLNNLKTLNCSNNSLTSLIVLGLSNLKSIYCSENQILNLNLSQNSNLQELYCENNQLTTLNISGLVNLHHLDCFNNLLQNLTLSGLTNLQVLRCYNNQLSNLDLTQNTSLTDVYCYDNLLTNLNVLGLNNLEGITCNNNLLTSLNVTQNTGLYSLECSNNQLTALDLTHNTTLYSLYCGNNQLETLIIKNNSYDMFQTIVFYNNPLQYICCDEEEIVYIQQLIDSYNYTTTCQANSYCNFNPGGTFYTIQGNNRYDNNNNGCDTNDINYPNLKFNITDGTSAGTFISNPSGNYTIPVSLGTHTFTPQLENPTYFTISPTTANVTFPATASPFTQNFCITANGVRHDLEIVIIPVTPARPGFDATYKLKYKNKGNQVENASLALQYNFLVMNLVSSSVTPTPANFGILNWNLGTLNPFQQGEIIVTFNLNSPTESPALNTDEVINFTSNITSSNTDQTPNDNHSNLSQTVVNSFDPNDKRCLEGTTINSAMIGEYLHYMIRFENTGTFPAQNIVVKDLIDLAKFDITTLQMTDASHACYTRINGNKVEFIFENINLDFNDATNDGYVVFKIKTLTSLPVNAQITNTANIYFDYNFPITTNTATTNFTILQNDSFDFTSYFTIYPNPVKDILNIKSNQNIDISSITIYTLLGQIVQTITQPAPTIDVSDLKTGNYFLKVTSDKGTATTKFIKE